MGKNNVNRILKDVNVINHTINEILVYKKLPRFPLIFSDAKSRHQSLKQS